ncbi:apolipoprotein N-acyltransferase [Williamsia sterculiae]|uniref:Apolipoprotein N-acyltransferase n=1 Tax=Williamsia sterculiae TaxID=1344003 RepID=A0A1N7ENW6_9NOCA|nr:apolipoprotein N-acyltransferase [Williamsia sterculiae]SIR89760.1 Apolipoprotein N-acyltransferase [Williamsia sterculiae]
MTVRDRLAAAPDRAAVVRWAVPTVIAAVAGVLLWAAFPPRNLWYLAVLSTAAFAGLLRWRRPRVRTGLWWGFVYGLGFYLPLLPWIGVYVGPLPWIALAVALALYQGFFGVVATLTMRLPGAPVWFGLSWVAVEWLRSNFPFGGFPWGRVAFSQVGSPLLPVAALAGAPGLSFAVVLTGASLATLVVTGTRRTRSSGDVRGAVVGVVCLLVGPVCAAVMWSPVHDRDESSDTVTIAVVQGNVPRLGLDFNAQRRAVLDNHIAETARLAASIRAGREPRPDVVLWPENASDIDPLRNADAAAEIGAASADVGAPILVGTLIYGDDRDDRPTNTVLVWDGERGPIGRYDKKIIQPFGEYLPWRSFFRLFSSYADQAGNFRPGSGPGVLTVRAATTTSEQLRVGVSTCWEVAFDRSARDAVRNGAQLLDVPTNNATFGRTQMTYQQLAMSQVRAVEHGRTVAVAATTGVSAIVAPDGSATRQTDFFTPAHLTARVPLQTTTTLATRMGAVPELLGVVVAALGFLFALVFRTRFSGRMRRHAVPSGTRDGSGPGVSSTRAVVASPTAQRAKEPDGSGD